MLVLTQHTRAYLKLTSSTNSLISLPLTLSAVMVEPTTAWRQFSRIKNRPERLMSRVNFCPRLKTWQGDGECLVLGLVPIFVAWGQRHRHPELNGSTQFQVRVALLSWGNDSDYGALRNFDIYFNTVTHKRRLLQV